MKANLRQLLALYRSAKKPRFSFKRSHFNGIGVCGICAKDEERLRRDVINQDLSTSWDLSKSEKTMFDSRESSVCMNCKTSLRSSQHAKAISSVLSDKETLHAAMETKKFQKLKIAEINACGSVHTHIASHPNLTYSEYKPADKSIEHQDITGLTYSDNEFDAVLTSDTLEHVPDWQAGLAEIYRVLKPGGHHIFTIPAIMTRTTRNRAIIENGKIVNILPKSFHGCTRGVDSDDYIVCNEFGVDILDSLEKAGFATDVYYLNMLRPSDPNIVFVSRKA